MSELERQLREVRQGDHLCLIYETPDEQMAAAAPFLRTGLERNERCVYIADESSVEGVAAALAAAGVDVARAQADGRLLVLTKKDAYLRTGAFEPQAMIAFLLAAERAALAAGFAGLRVTGEMTWALGPETGCDRLIEYEALLNTIFPGSHVAAICQYSRRRFPPAILQQVLKTHPIAIVGGEVCPNLYYEPSEQALGRASDADALAWQITRLRELHRTQQALRQSEQHSRRFLETAQEGVWIRDENDVTTFVNQRMAAMLGYSVEEMTGRPVTDFFDAQARVAVTARLEQRREGRTDQYDFAFQRKDGSLLWGLVAANPLFDDDGRYAGALALVTDVTARKLAEAERDQLLEEERQARALAEAAKERLALLAAIVESSNAAIIGRDLDGAVVSWNPAAERLYGYTAAEAVGQPIGVIVPPDREDELHGVLDHIRRGRPIRPMETVRRRKDGSLVNVSLSVSPIRDDSGRLLGAATIAEDITERKRLEATLRERTELLERVFANIHIAIAYLDRDLNFVRVNEAYAREDERTPEFFPGKSHFALYPNVENEAIFRQVAASGQPFRATARPFVYAEHPERGVTYWDWSLDPVQDGSGQVAGLVLSLLNVTQRQQAMAEIERLNAELERRVEERTAQLESTVKELEAFSYSVSHDLRAPLRAIDGFSQILLQDFAADLSPEAQRYLGIVRTNAQQMGQLIDDLLRFSRLNRQPLTRQRVDTAALVADALEVLLAGREERRSQITIGELLPCTADPILLRQVFINLLDNALKFSRNRPQPQITVGCRVEDGRPVYYVQDNGVGFDMQYADKLFRVFQRLHSPADYEGTGIGLAMVQRIVRRHGGQIWAEAAEDRGATFFFTLGEEDLDGERTG